MVGETEQLYAKFDCWGVVFCWLVSRPRWREIPPTGGSRPEPGWLSANCRTRSCFTHLTAFIKTGQELVNKYTETAGTCWHQTLSRRNVTNFLRNLRKNDWRWELSVHDKDVISSTETVFYVIAVDINKRLEVVEETDNDVSYEIGRVLPSTCDRPRQLLSIC